MASSLSDSEFNSLSADGKILLKFLKNEFDNLRSEFQVKFVDLRNEFSSFTEAKNLEINNLQTKVDQLTNELNKVKDSVDSADAYERRDTIVFSGSSIPNASQGENCAVTIQGLVSEKLRIQISTTDISSAHRIGPKPPNQQPDKRSIIAKFCRREVKNEVFLTSRRTKAPGFFVNESLTPIRSTIYRTLRNIRKSHPQLVKGCSTFDGNVWAYTKNPNSERDLRHNVNTHERLVRFCADFVKQPLNTFLDSWSF